MLKLFAKLFSKKQKDIVEPSEVHYCCVINDRFNWFDTKEAMLKFIDSYSKENQIFSLSMYRHDIFNLIK